MITEIQITCAILMILSFIACAFISSRFITSGKIYGVARNLLLVGIALIALHFTIQYVLHKYVADLEQIRTIINLLFGFPISFFINFSLVYLQKVGQIKKWEWGIMPLLYLIAISVFIVFVGVLHLPNGMYVSSVVMSILYASELMLCCYMQISGYFHCLNRIHHKGEDYFIPLVRYTKWSVVFMTLVSLGFPLMTFNENLLFRSLYGILSISAGFFYIFCFMSFGFYLSSRGKKDGEPFTVLSRQEDARDEIIDEDGEKTYISEQRLKQCNQAIENFIEGDYYLLEGITFKDIAQELNMPQSLFRQWLHQNGYERFNTWLVGIRLNRAKEMLLKNPHLTNEEVAHNCGFCDRQYFHSQFKKNVGMSPSNWLKSEKIKLQIEEDNRNN